VQFKYIFFYSSTSNPDSTVSTHNTLLIGLYWHVVHLLGVQIDPLSPASQVDARRGVRVFVVGTAVYRDRRVVSYIVKMAHKILTHLGPTNRRKSGSQWWQRTCGQALLHGQCEAFVRVAY